MRFIGLTGGIASGKSTVGGYLRELGAHLIDADQVAREVVEPGTEGLREVAERFPFAIAPDGRLDRKALGAWIFSRPDERAALNAIVHPRIQDAVREKTERLEAQGVRQVVYDAPLLIENGLHHAMDAVILVAVPREVQLQRLIARDGLTREEAEARLASQLPLEEKRKVATHVVDNAGSLSSTREQVERIWRELSQRP